MMIHICAYVHLIFVYQKKKKKSKGLSDLLSVVSFLECCHEAHNFSALPVPYMQGSNYPTFAWLRIGVNGH